MSGLRQLFSQSLLHLLGRELADEYTEAFITIRGLDALNGQNFELSDPVIGVFESGRQDVLEAGKRLRAAVELFLTVDTHLADPDDALRIKIMIGRYAANAQAATNRSQMVDATNRLTDSIDLLTTERSERGAIEYSDDLRKRRVILFLRHHMIRSLHMVLMIALPRLIGGYLLWIPVAKNLPQPSEMFTDLVTDFWLKMIFAGRLVRKNKETSISESSAYDEVIAHWGITRSVRKVGEWSLGILSRLFLGSDPFFGIILSGLMTYVLPPFVLDVYYSKTLTFTCLFFATSYVMSVLRKLMRAIQYRNLAPIDSEVARANVLGLLSQLGPSTEDISSIFRYVANNPLPPALMPAPALDATTNDIFDNDAFSDAAVSISSDPYDNDAEAFRIIDPLDPIIGNIDNANFGAPSSINSLPQRRRRSSSSVFRSDSSSPRRLHYPSPRTSDPSSSPYDSRRNNRVIDTASASEPLDASNSLGLRNNTAVTRLSDAELAWRRRYVSDTLTSNVTPIQDRVSLPTQFYQAPPVSTFETSAPVVRTIRRSPRLLNKAAQRAAQRAARNNT